VGCKEWGVEGVGERVEGARGLVGGGDDGDATAAAGRAVEGGEGEDAVGGVGGGDAIGAVGPGVEGGWVGGRRDWDAGWQGGAGGGADGGTL
jgi:hypothetical protein